MAHYLRWPIKDLPFNVGVEQADGSRISENAEGFISFGPAVRLGPGTYFGGFYTRALVDSNEDDVIRVDACSHSGKNILAGRSVPGRELCSNVFGLVGIDFEINDESSDVEVRLYVRSASASIAVRSLVVFRKEIF